jgi:hypothetical protein
MRHSDSGPSWLARIGLAVAGFGLAGAVVVFVKVQILQSYPFHSGVFGNQALLPGITYTVALELFSAAAVTGLFLRAYSKSVETGRYRIVYATGTMLMIVGLIVAPIIYTEIHILWGEILPGVHFWQGLPGGGGYPWGGEQVAYNTCLVPSRTPGDCSFLNYDELFWMALLAIPIGYVLRHLR